MGSWECMLPKTQLIYLESKNLHVTVLFRVVNKKVCLKDPVYLFTGKKKEKKKSTFDD